MVHAFHRKFNAVNECAGYRDLQFNVLVDGTELIWELQVHLEEIELMKTKLTAETDETGRTGQGRSIAVLGVRDDRATMRGSRRRRRSLRSSPSWPAASDLPPGYSPPQGDVF